jgi:hypothetical protein
MTDFLAYNRAKSKSMAGHVLSSLFSVVGATTTLHISDAKEMSLGLWKNICNKHGGTKQTLVARNSLFKQS